MLQELPDFNKFQMDRPKIASIEYQWKNRNHGGSLMKGVLNNNGEVMMNYLNTTFGEISRQQRHKSQYFIFNNIMTNYVINDDYATFADVHILANAASFSSEGIRIRDEQAVNLVETGPVHRRKMIPYIRLDKINFVLNGFARMTIYKSFNPMNMTYEFDSRIKFDPVKDPYRNEIVEIREGEFKNGQLSGYGRIITSDGTTRVGYFLNNNEYGKI